MVSLSDAQRSVQLAKAEHRAGITLGPLAQATFDVCLELLVRDEPGWAGWARASMLFAAYSDELHIPGCPAALGAELELTTTPLQAVLGGWWVTCGCVAHGAALDAWCAEHRFTAHESARLILAEPGLEDPAAPLSRVCALVALAAPASLAPDPLLAGVGLRVLTRCGELLRARPAPTLHALLEALVTSRTDRESAQENALALLRGLPTTSLPGPSRDSGTQVLLVLERAAAVRSPDGLPVLLLEAAAAPDLGSSLTLVDCPEHLAALLLALPHERRRGVHGAVPPECPAPVVELACALLGEVACSAHPVSFPQGVATPQAAPVDLDLPAALVLAAELLAS